jgi:hypothetical protein
MRPKKLFIVLMTDDGDRMVQRVLLVHRHCLDLITEHAAIVVAQYVSPTAVKVVKSRREDIKRGSYHHVGRFLGKLSGLKLVETHGRGKPIGFNIETLDVPTVIKKKCTECGHVHKGQRRCRELIAPLGVVVECRCDGH